MNVLTYRSARVLAGILTVATTAVLTAQAPAAVRHNTDRNKVAAKGYDVVAYFSDQRAAAGTPTFSHDWQGVTWRFATAGNRDLFAAAPEKYAPQYGGFCAFAVSKGYTASIDPEAWSIVDNKLYLNYSKGVRGEWLTERDANIAKGDKNWPALSRQR